MLLPEEPAPELGVKSTGLHFLTAGDQGVGPGQGRRQGRRGASGSVSLSSPRPPQAFCACGRRPLGSVYTHSPGCQAPGKS